jgi:hypothetical protein
MKQRSIGLKRAYELPAVASTSSHDTEHNAVMALREYVARPNRRHERNAS